MKYIIKGSYITFTIDDTFKDLSINEFFQYFHLSKKTIHLLKQNKEYTLNKHYVSSQTILNKNDKLTIKAFQKDDYMYSPTPSSIEIIYEDEFLLIVNKPAFLPIYPDHQDKQNSLNHYVSYYYHQMGYDLPIRPIHRLDNDTTGLVIYCKCQLIQSLLDAQLSKKQIKRYYKAIVEGNISDKKHTIQTFIANDRHHNSKMRVSKSGKEAITHYRLIKNYNNLALIECELETGRKHQIRVHMAYINHPLIGDKLYNRPSRYINRQALHAYCIEMVHPITLKKLHIECSLPDDFLFVMKRGKL